MVHLRVYIDRCPRRGLLFLCAYLQGGREEPARWVERESLHPPAARPVGTGPEAGGDPMGQQEGYLAAFDPDPAATKEMSGGLNIFGAPDKFGLTPDAHLRCTWSRAHRSTSS